LVVALTGGIGAGKSSASALLEAKGAVLVDADRVAKDLQRAGEPGFVAMVDKFGDDIVGPDGELDRPKIAAMVFADKGKLAELNTIMFPLIGLSINERILANKDTDNVVLLDIPLLGASGNAYEVKGTIVVDCPVEVALDRLVTSRGMDAEDAARRIAAQITREERLELADFVIDNAGSADDLAAAVDACWAWIQTLR
jgi:dephospho-CoA kinase